MLLLLPVRLYSASTSGLSTSKLRPISSLQNSSYFGRVHLGLPSFNFLGSHFFLFVRAALVIIKPNCSQKCGTKNGPATQPHFWNLWGPFLWPFRNKVQWERGPKLGPPKTQIETQNWCQFLSPSCLPRDAISKYIKTDILARMRQASRQEIAARQRRDLAKMREDSRQASTSIHTDIQSRMSKKLVTLLDLCVSSLRRGHANLLCIVPILSDDPRRESTGQ